MDRATLKPTDEQVEWRKQVVAWTDKARTIDAARSHVAERRAQAMWTACLVGVPISHIAADIDVDPAFVSRAITDYADRHNLPRKPVTSPRNSNPYRESRKP